MNPDRMNLGKKLLFPLIAVLIGLVVSEILVRLILPDDFFLVDTGRTYRPDPVLHRSHVPFSKGREWSKFPEDGFDVRYAYDQHGMRRNNDYLDTEKPRGECRILLIGDSFVEQRQLHDDQLVQTKLEEILNAKGKAPVKVFAYGVSGWGTVNYDLYYKTKARGFGADWVFVFLSFNDFQDDELFHEPNAVYSRSGELLASPAQTEKYHSGSQPDPNSPSIIWDLIKYTREKSKLVMESEKLLRPGPKARPHQADSLFLLDVSRIPASRLRVRKSLSNLQDLKVFADTDGSSTAIVIIPFPHQLSSSEWSIGRSWTGISKDYHEKSTVYQDLSKEVSIDFGIQTIDLLHPLQGATGEDHIFFPFDGHFSPFGAQKIAEILAEFVQKNDPSCGRFLS